MVETKVKLELSDCSSDSEEEEVFHINKDYANKYDKWRHKEEFQKLKAKYGDSSPSSSSSSESEDEVEPIIEKDFLKTLSLLKSKDPKIYDENQKFFTGVNEIESKSKIKKIKPLYLKDYERNRLLETNGKLDSEDDDEKTAHVSNFSTYDEEQQEIKTSFKEALKDMDSSEDDDDNLLQVRQKNTTEKVKEQADYIEWLKGEKEELSKEKSDEDLKYLHDYWNDPDLETDEQFLRDYILNKKYIEEQDNEIPTYEEITNDINDLSDDEDNLNKQEVFEHKYNFRFEEPDSEFIKQYPRTIGDSLRRVDNKRKLKRENYQERKLKEKEQKKEEIKRLKALKRMQIEEMLSKLKETTGNDQLGFDYSDIDGDFDPNEHDKKMKELFNDEFYEVDEVEKPQFPSDEEIDSENWDFWNGDDNQYNYDEDGPHCEDSNFNMDADYDPKLEFQKQMMQSQSFKKGKKKKRKSKLAEALSKSKPVFDPSKNTLEQYIDEYYKLDFEDVVGNEVYRFKYRNVIPNNFGLSMEEILKARDKELNKWCSLKKTCQHRSEQEEKCDIATFINKAKNLNTKQKYLPSLFEDSENQRGTTSVPPSSETEKKRKRKRKNHNLPENEKVEDNNIELKAKHMKTNDNNEDAKINIDIEIKTELSSINCDNNAQDQNYITTKKKCKKKKKSKGLNNVNETSNASFDKKSDCNDNVKITHQNSDIISNLNMSKKKKRNKKKSSDRRTQGQNTGSKFANIDDKRLLFSDARLKAYGINPKKFKNRIKYSSLNKKTENV